MSPCAIRLKTSRRSCMSKLLDKTAAYLCHPELVSGPRRDTLKPGCWAKPGMAQSQFKVTCTETVKNLGKTWANNSAKASGKLSTPVHTFSPMRQLNKSFTQLGRLCPHLPTALPTDFYAAALAIFQISRYLSPQSTPPIIITTIYN